MNAPEVKTVWTAADESVFRELSERRDRIRKANRDGLNNCLLNKLKVATLVADDDWTAFLDALEVGAGDLREALKPFDLTVTEAATTNGRNSR